MTASDRHDQPGRLDAATNALAQQLLSVGIDGRGPLPPAQKVADKALAQGGDLHDVTKSIVNAHTRLAGAEGFVTGLGGFLVMPVAIPANIIGFYTLATRMTAAIAAANGHDVTDPVVRSTILVCLTGEDAIAVLRKAGVAGVGATSTVSTHVLAGLPPSVLMVINKGVAFRIVTGLGKRWLSRLGRGIPLAGGVIGGALDAMLIRRIAKAAREQFPPITRAAA